MHTETGSVYEVQPKSGGGYRVRRLINGAPAPDNVCATAQWRNAMHVSKPVVGRPMMIEWGWCGDILEATCTSYVTSIEMGKG